MTQAKIIHLEAGQKFDDADIKVSGGQPTREITVRLVAETGELPDINYVEGKGSDMDEPVHYFLRCGFAFRFRGGKAGRAAAEAVVATVDHSDIRGSEPHNRDPSGAASD